MKKILFILLGLQLLSAQEIESQYNFQESVFNLKEIFKEKNIKIFAEIDHSEEAKNVEKFLFPTKVLIVGNPKIGTDLMQENQDIALHLPLKILIYQTKNDQVIVRYQEITPLVKSYKMEKSLHLAMKIDEAMLNLIGKLTSKQVEW